MRAKMFALAIVVGALVSASPALAGEREAHNATMCVHTTQLSAANELSSTSTARGHTQIKVRNDGTIEFKTKILNPDRETFVAGHIHSGPSGVNGPVVQPIFVDGPTSHRHIRQRGERTNATLGAAICAHPELYYLNYHTTANKGGAIRGQLD